MAEQFTLADFAYAHRGLWTPDGPPENSLSACLAAAGAGLGIEFDVRPAADGAPVIFHDATLERMTAHTGRAGSRTTEQLKRIRLNDSTETIPTFQQLLDVWPGKTPLLTEIKIDGGTDPAPFARTIGNMLAQHDGPAAAMSFSPQAVAALPDTMMRGQLVLPVMQTSEETFLTHMQHGLDIGADYLCVWHEDAGPAFAFAQENGLALGVYTVRSASKRQALTAIDPAIAVIFEGFDPALAKPHG